jgi:hypothetical protein
MCFARRQTMMPVVQPQIGSPSQKIAQRQASIYRLSVILSLLLVFLWAPVLAVAPGTGCRPMGEVLMTALLLLLRYNRMLWMRS